MLPAKNNKSKAVLISGSFPEGSYDPESILQFIKYQELTFLSLLERGCDTFIIHQWNSFSRLAIHVIGSFKAKYSGICLVGVFACEPGAIFRVPGVSDFNIEMYPDNDCAQLQGKDLFDELLDRVSVFVCHNELNDPRQAEILSRASTRDIRLVCMELAATTPQIAFSNFPVRNGR